MGDSVIVAARAVARSQSHAIADRARQALRHRPPVADRPPHPICLFKGECAGRADSAGRPGNHLGTASTANVLFWMSELPLFSVVHFMFTVWAPIPADITQVKDRVSQQNAGYRNWTPFPSGAHGVPSTSQSMTGPARATTSRISWMRGVRRRRATDLEDVRSAGGVEHVRPLQEIRERLAVLTVADEPEAAGRRDVARNAAHAAAPAPKREVQRQVCHVNASDHESPPTSSSSGYL